MNPRESFGECAAIQEQLSAYLDGECAPEEALRVERHLGDCAACRRELAALERLTDALGELMVPCPPLRLPRLQARRAARWQALTLAASLLLGLATGSGLAGLLYPGLANGGQMELATLEEVMGLDGGAALGSLELLAPEDEDSGS